MTVKKGFSLLEFLIYFFLVMLVSTLIIDFMASRYVIMREHGRACDNTIALCAAADLLERDIQTSVSPDTQWKVIGNNEYIWSDHQDIGWQVKNGRLIRSYGQYDHSEALWTKCTRGIIAEQVSGVRIKPQKNDAGMRCVHCILESEKANYVVHRIIALRNRGV